MKRTVATLLAVCLACPPVFANGGRVAAVPVGRPALAAPVLPAAIPSAPSSLAPLPALGLSGIPVLGLPAQEAPLAQAAAAALPAVQAAAADPYDDFSLLRAADDGMAEPTALESALPRDSARSAEPTAPESAQAEASPRAELDSLAEASGQGEAPRVAAAFDGSLPSPRAEDEPAAPAARDAYDSHSLLRAADDGMKEPPEDDGEGVPEPDRAPRARFWPAVSLGIALATLAPVLYHSAPPATLFYTVPAAFLGAGLLAAAIAAARVFHGLILASVNRRLAPEERFRLPALRRTSSGWGVFLAGLGLGAAVILLLPLVLPVLAVPLALHAAAAAFTAAGASHVVERGYRFARALIRWNSGASAGEFVRSLESPGFWSRRVVFWMGAGLGLAAGLAAFLTHDAVALSTMAYVGVLAFAGAWALWFFSELAYLASALRRVALHLLGAPMPRRPGESARGALYAAGLAAGLLFGWAPGPLTGEAVETGFRVGEAGARHIQRDEKLMRAMPEDWRALVRFLAEASDVREVGPAFAEETQAALSENPKGRRLLDSLRDRGGRVSMPRFFVARQTRSGAFENPVAHGVFLNTDHVLARGWTMEEFLADPAKQRALARELAQLSFHELTHTKQSFRFYWRGPLPGFFPGQFDRFPRQLTSVVHLELEYEAHISDQLYLHEELKKDPHYPHGDIGGYLLFLEDLDAFLAGIDESSTYEGFAHVEADYYKQFLAGVRARMPELREEGYAALARRFWDWDRPRAEEYLRRSLRK